MIVNCRIFNVKVGLTEEAVQLLKQAIEDNTSYQHRYRICTPNIGASNDVVVVEFEYEDLDEYRKTWAEWFASPLATAFMPKWAKLVERGGCNEVWNLPEQRS